MKTVKIKVEIEAEVPEGKYCLYCDNCSGYYCTIFDKVRKIIEVPMSDGIHNFFKCQSCLDACEKTKGKKI